MLTNINKCSILFKKLANVQKCYQMLLGKIELVFGIAKLGNYTFPDGWLDGWMAYSDNNATQPAGAGAGLSLAKMFTNVYKCLKMLTNLNIC